MAHAELEDLIGKTFTEVRRGEDSVRFVGEKSYALYHEQDCCESVYLDDVVGDLVDLVGTPILSAYEETNSDNPKTHGKYKPDSFTWTFYRIATAKGTVTLRFYGESNGYYSESVSIKKVR